MKTLRKLLALTLALLLVLSLSVSAMAADITIGNANKGETYTAYKIFDATQGTGSTAYTIDKDSSWKTAIENFKYDINSDSTPETIFTLKETTGGGDALNVTFPVAIKNNTNLAAALAKHLKENTPSSGLTQNTDYWTVTGADSGNTTFSNLPLGYYFVTTTTGSLCSLDTNNDTVAIQEKNTLPSLELKIGTVEGTYGTQDVSVSIGDTVYYQVTVTVPATVTGDVKLHDILDSGLTITDGTLKTQTGADATAAASANKVDATADTTTCEDCSFDMTLDDTTYAGKTVIITFQATLDSDAVIKGDTPSDKNKNTAWLSYSKQTTVGTAAVVNVVAYKMSLIKVDANDSTNKLEGVKFNLLNTKNDAADGDALYFVKVTGTENYYRAAKQTDTGATQELVTGSGGVIEIRGLAGNTVKYALRETETLAGYNLLAADKIITIADANNMYSETEGQENNVIKNSTGSELPSTGGIGTTIFYVVGGLLMVGAVVLLVTKRKMSGVE